MQHVLVIGGGSGIGAAVASRFLAQSARVVCVDNNLEACRAMQNASLVDARSDADVNALRVVCADASDFESLSKALTKVQGEASLANAPAVPFSWDVLVNCAGVDQHQFFTESEPSEWQGLMQVNLNTVLNSCKLVLPGMQSRRAGRIVNVASEAGRLGSKGGSVYAASKAAVIGLSKSLARENGRFGITVNVVAPGPIDTPMVTKALDAAEKSKPGNGVKLNQAMIASTLLGRLGLPDEVAAAIEFLCSPQAAFITGEVLSVSGGMGCGL